MEDLDESLPTKRLCQPVDITPTNINFDHDAWDIAEAFPDVIRDIESSLKEAKPDSAAALLGLDIDLDDNDHHFCRLDSRGSSNQDSGGSSYQDSGGSSRQDIGQVGEAEDFSVIEEAGGSSRVEKEREERGQVTGEAEDLNMMEEAGGSSREEEREERGQVTGEAQDLTMMEEAGGSSREEEIEERGQEGGAELGQGEEQKDEEMFLEEDNERWKDEGGSDDEMIVLDEDGDDYDDNDIDDEDIEPDYSTQEHSSSASGFVKSNNSRRSKFNRRTNNSSSARESIADHNLDEEADDLEDEGDDEEGEMEEWDSDSEGDIDALLDEGLPEQYKQNKGDGSQQVKGRKKAGETWRKVLTQGALPEGLIGVKEKTVLKRHGQEPLEGLPDGWIRISHQCGMPVYLHRPSRVCSWSRPYLLGSGSARRHRVPVAAIPCMHYSRALEKEKKAQLESEGKGEETDIKTKSADLPNGDISDKPLASTSEAGNPTNPDAEMKDEESSEKGEGPKNKKKSRVHICEDDSIDGKDLQEYLSRLFQFEKIAIKRFNSWAARRKYTKAVKHKDRPQFPGGPKVIRCQIPGNKGREFVINAQDKTPVCILHEYAQRVMRTQPQYIFGESRNASAPFEAVVEIMGTKYGRGEATSKRLAKAEAAKKTLDILVPELISDFKTKAPSDTEYFDHVAIDDIRIYDLCMKAGQLTPWQVLQEYIQRSHGMADTKFSMNIKLKNHQRSEYTLTLGPHTVTGMCKNKANGKQQGAQKLLKQLHPELRSWGAIIKMYGKGSSEINREKKEAEQSVTELTQATPRARPNRKILNKLRLEMIKAYGEKNLLDAEVERQKKQGEDIMEEDSQKEPHSCCS